MPLPCDRFRRRGGIPHRRLSAGQALQKERSSGPARNLPPDLEPHGAGFLSGEPAAGDVLQRSFYSPVRCLMLLVL